MTSARPNPPGPDPRPDSPVPRLRPFRAEDLEAALALNAESAPHVARLDAGELLAYAESATVALVATIHEAVTAYLVAFAWDAPCDGEEFQAARLWLDHFLHIDQVAVAGSARGRGIGSALYDALVPGCRARGITALTCGVNLDPPNPGSLRFHTRLGFAEIGRVTTRDGNLVALLRKDLTGDR